MNDQYNPDVLSCLANLSNDEVFTPPKVVNDMLDLLPPELFRDSKTTFLDIGCKSGVFLREIAKRLITGLADELPDLQQRVDHILHHQLYGIATTELTSLVSRRTLYCSKYPNCRYSASRFDTPEGNIRFRNIPHDFVNGRCKWCGASEDQFGDAKRNGLETHAYEFIHTTHPKEIFKMKFDVIVGNPPYQLNTGGSKAQATPLYDKFVEQAIKLSPRFLTMIIPSRWFTGGFGLDGFREAMIKDTRIKVVHDFINAEECFGLGVEIKGGVCYFLWDRSHSGDCHVVTHEGDSLSIADRRLKEEGVDAFIRRNEGVSIYHKVKKLREGSMMDLVSSQKPFGLGTMYKGRPHDFARATKLYQNGGVGFVDRNEILKGAKDVDRYKVYLSAGYNGGDKFPHQIINKPIFGERNSCCTETYVYLGPFDTRNEAENLITYIHTKFFRCMVMLLKNTQHALKKVYQLVPMQDFSKPWTDAELYAKYKLTKDEIAFIESMIKPME